jgi:hypothetical protein
VPTSILPAAPDLATVDRLATAVNRCFETFAADADVFTADAFFDLFPPFWRFQLQGPAALLAQLREIARGPTAVRTLRLVPTATGFVLEHEETSGEEVARRLLLCEVRDGRVAELVVYCNGEWDRALQARQAAEAPMLRPDRRVEP